MLKLPKFTRHIHDGLQPPSGGCVLKHYMRLRIIVYCIVQQPPSGGCVLKPYGGTFAACFWVGQPPSGGCVLKPLPFGHLLV